MSGLCMRTVCSHHEGDVVVFRVMVHKTQWHAGVVENMDIVLGATTLDQ